MGDKYASDEQVAMTRSGVLFAAHDDHTIVLCAALESLYALHEACGRSDC